MADTPELNPLTCTGVEKGRARRSTVAGLAEEVASPTLDRATVGEGTGARVAAGIDVAEFCKLLTQASALVEPDPPGTEPPPERTQAEFDDIAALLAQAEVAAPPKLTADIATFADAIDEYRGALADVGYNLGAIYSTPEGIALANDTSHALSPAVVRHMKGPCGVAPNGGEERTP